MTDDLAAKLSITGDDPRRLRGAVSAVVREQYDEGSTAIPAEAACLLAAVKIESSASVEEIQATIGEAIERKQLCQIGDGKDCWLATPNALEYEQIVWRMLQESTDCNPTIGERTDEWIEKLAAEYTRLPINGTECLLDENQIQAVRNAARYRFSVVTGGAGAGKTLVARAITKMFLDDDVPVALCAPTGKAAKRLSEVVGREAKTIHRLLEYSGKDGRFMRDENCFLFLNREYSETEGKLEVSGTTRGVVLLDEASMLDAELASRLFRAVGPQTSVVFIGDPNQLPPVGPGAVLRDIIANDLAPITALKHCHRQAGTLKKNCNGILSGRVEPWANDEEPSPWVVSRQCSTVPKVLKTIEELYTKHLPSWGYNPITDTQFMTAKHDGLLGTRRLNTMLQRLHQKSLGNDLGPVGEDEHEHRPTFYAGDKVIHTKNNYTLGVMNGNVGVVHSVNPVIVVKYDGEEIEYKTRTDIDQLSLGYCLSVHKTQGSEYPCAVVIVPKSHSFMQHRHWLYTAATRAKKTTCIIGDSDGIDRAAMKVENDKRFTLLQTFAMCEAARP